MQHVIRKLQFPILQYTYQMHQFLGEAFTGGNQATGKTTHSGQALHEMSDKERYLGRPSWVLLVRVTS